MSYDQKTEDKSDGHKTCPLARKGRRDGSENYFIILSVITQLKVFFIRDFLAKYQFMSGYEANVLNCLTPTVTQWN